MKDLSGWPGEADVFEAIRGIVQNWVPATDNIEDQFLDLRLQVLETEKSGVRWKVWSGLDFDAEFGDREYSGYGAIRFGAEDYEIARVARDILSEAEDRCRERYSK